MLPVVCGWQAFLGRFRQRAARSGAGPELFACGVQVPSRFQRAQIVDYALGGLMLEGTFGLIKHDPIYNREMRGLKNARSRDQLDLMPQWRQASALTCVREPATRGTLGLRADTCCPHLGRERGEQPLNCAGTWVAASGTAIGPTCRFVAPNARGSLTWVPGLLRGSILRVK